MSLNWAFDMKVRVNLFKLAIFLNHAQLLNPSKCEIISLIISKNIMKNIVHFNFFCLGKYISDFDDELNLQNRINL